jgi:hypothetical protein
MILSCPRMLLAPLTCVFLAACTGQDTKPVDEPRPEGAAAPIAAPVAPYVPGTAILFGEGGGDAPYLRDGWSFPERGLRWTEGSQAGLALAIPAPSTDLVLEVTFATALTAPGSPVQRVVVSANGTRLSEWQVKAAGSHTASIPKGLLANGILNLRFELLDATEPPRVNASSDSRVLAVGFHSLNIQTPKA